MINKTILLSGLITMFICSITIGLFTVFFISKTHELLPDKYKTDFKGTCYRIKDKPNCVYKKDKGVNCYVCTR